MIGGSLRALVNIAEAMADSNTHVTISAPVGPQVSHRTVNLMDPRIERRLFRASRPLARFGGSVRQMLWLWRSAGSFDQIQIHSIFAISSVYAIAISSMRRVPVLLWAHGSLLPDDLRKHARVKRALGPLLTKRLLDQCAALLFTTTRESEEAITYGSNTPREVVALPVAPLDLTDAKPEAWKVRYGIPAEVPLVLFLSRIDYKKRLPLLVEAMSHLKNTDAHLVIVGDGPATERRLVDQAILRHGLGSRVHFTGWVEGTDRTGAFAAGDVFVLLSDFENFGLAVVEAMSAGCPVVISRQVYLASDLESADAVLCVDRDPMEAAAAIDRALDDSPEILAMIERARTLSRLAFAPKSVAARIEQISAVALRD